MVIIIVLQSTKKNEILYLSICSVAKQLMEEDKLRRILDIFEMEESLKNFENLALLFEIVKNISLLNDKAIFTALSSKENWKQWVGALEYDPLRPHPKDMIVTRHRDHLSRYMLVFKQKMCVCIIFPCLPFSFDSTTKVSHNTWVILYGLRLKPPGHACQSTKYSPI